MHTMSHSLQGTSEDKKHSTLIHETPSQSFYSDIKANLLTNTAVYEKRSTVGGM